MTPPSLDLRYPIGRFEPPAAITPQLRSQWIAQLADAPRRLRDAVRGLTAEQLDTPYRPGGWTVRQVIHHVADSHVNSYVRFRLALTEANPTIKPYQESRWAELEDARTGPVEVSLDLIESLHGRWVALLKSLSSEQFASTFEHPERGRASLDVTLPMYAWHSRHHEAHITTLVQRMGWSRV
jgi:uncharacterized damage-inducible protein DinB